MRICLVSPYNPKAPTGIGEFTANLAQGIQDSRNDVVLVTAKSEMGGGTNRHGFPIVELGFPPRPLGDITLAIRTAIYLIRARHNHDVIHVQQAHLQSCSATITGRVLGKTVLATIHLKRTHFSSSLERVAESVSERIIRKACKKLVFVSHHTRGAFAGDGPVIHNGVDTRRFHPNEEKSQITQRKGPMRMIFVGRVTRTKGFFDLLDAMAIVQRNHGKGRVHLVAVGPLPQNERNLVYERIRNLDIADSLELTGPLADISTQLRNSELFVLPSHYEGFPISIVEAMSSGLPVIASKSGGIPEIIQDDMNGHLCEIERPDTLAEVISGYLDQPEKLREHGRNARTTVLESFGIQKMVNAYDRIYFSLLPRKDFNDVS